MKGAKPLDNGEIRSVSRKLEVTMLPSQQATPRFTYRKPVVFCGIVFLYPHFANTNESVCMDPLLSQVSHVEVFIPTRMENN